MEYRIGNSKHIDEIGETKPVICPACEQPVHFSIYRNRNLGILPETANPVFFTVCPECKSLFSLPHQNGKAFEKGDDTSVRTVDLRSLKDFKI